MSFIHHDVLDEIRSNYPKAVDDEALTKAMLQKIADLKLNTVTAVGYRGAFESLMAKHAFSVFTKLEYLKKAHASFQSALKVSPNHLEVRLLRYIVEFNTPAYVGYSKHLAEDKAKIFELVKTYTQNKPDKYQQYLLGVLLDKVALTTAEKKQIQALL
jgi:hypothetical protein